MRASTLFIALAVAACGPAGEHDHAHGDHAHGDHAHGDHAHGGHHDDGPTVSLTRFTDRLELFAEHPVAVVDETVGFLAHLTRLSDFSPVTEGEVTLVVEGPQTIRARADGPLRDGIFLPRFNPRTAGEYRMRLEVRAPGLEDVFDGMTLTVHPDRDAARDAAPAEDDTPTVSFLKEQQWQVPFATAFVEERALIPAVEVSAEVTTPPAGRAEIGASVAGRVVAPPAGLPQPGDRVEAGQLLATIAPAPASPEGGAQAGLAVAEAAARLATAESEAARAERLMADRAISARELELARREVAVAREAVAAARRAQSLFRGAAAGRGAGTWRLTSPIAGVVTSVDASPGRAVTPEDVLFRVVTEGVRWIVARVPEQDAGRVRVDADASYRVPGTDAWRTLSLRGDPPTAAVVNVGQTVDPRARTVDVIYAVETPDPALRVGARVRVAVPAGEPVTGPAIPRAALLDVEGRSVVFVQVQGESFEERTVRLGPRAGDWIGVERGLAAGERVVTSGARFIRLSDRAATGAGHGHVH